MRGVSVFVPLVRRRKTQAESQAWLGRGERGQQPCWLLPPQPLCLAFTAAVCFVERCVSTAGRCQVIAQPPQVSLLGGPSLLSIRTTWSVRMRTCCKTATAHLQSKPNANTLGTSQTNPEIDVEFQI